jgi:mono/diheme cytochrome c family protein
VKQILIALVITLVIAGGGIGLTFAFSSPDANAKLFSEQELERMDAEHRAGEPVITVVVGSGDNERTLVFNSRDEAAKLFSEEGLGQVDAEFQEIASGEERRTVLWDPDPETLELGRSLYNVRCMTCHGVNGDGKQVTPEYLSVPPRDFTGQSHAIGRLTFKFTSLNWTDPLALDEDLKKTIREGLPGTPMPGFQDMSDEELDAVLDYIKSFGYGWWKYQRPQKPAIEVPETPPDLASESRIDAGRQLFKLQGCLACHGDIEQGSNPPAELPTEWLDDEGNPIFITPRNFAVEPMRRPNVRDAFKTIRLGIGGTPMVPNAITDEQTWDLIAYIVHLRSTGR